MAEETRKPGLKLTPCCRRRRNVLPRVSYCEQEVSVMKYGDSMRQYKVNVPQIFPESELCRNEAGVLGVYFESTTGRSEFYLAEEVLPKKEAMPLTPESTERAKNNPELPAEMIAELKELVLGKVVELNLLEGQKLLSHIELRSIFDEDRFWGGDDLVLDKHSEGVYVLFDVGDKYTLAGRVESLHLTDSILTIETTAKTPIVTNLVLGSNSILLVRGSTRAVRLCLSYPWRGGLEEGGTFTLQCAVTNRVLGIIQPCDPVYSFKPDCA